MNKNNYAIVMAGGVGSRFWPFSRTSHPKQFQDILGTGQSILQQTIDRFENICPQENIYIVTHEQYKDLVKEHLPFLEDNQILLEPVRRNTAPCIAYASYKIAAKNPDANLVVSPADHIIQDKRTFENTILEVLEHTKTNDILVTLGIHPTRPDTGYGYIQETKNESIGSLRKVKMFTEKPPLEVAQTFLDSGEFVWNSGIFIWNANAIIEEFNQHLYDIHYAFKDLESVYYTEKEKEALKIAYYQCKNVSIDYGIMEKSAKVYVMRSNFDWSDLGTWKSLHDLAEKDESQNVLQGNIMHYDTKGSIIKTPEERLVVVQGLENFIVAEYDNVLVICKKDHEQQIKQFVKDAKERAGDKYI